MVSVVKGFKEWALHVLSQCSLHRYVAHIGNTSDIAQGVHNSSKATLLSKCSSQVVHVLWPWTTCFASQEGSLVKLTSCQQCSGWYCTHPLVKIEHLMWRNSFATKPFRFSPEGSNWSFEALLIPIKFLKHFSSPFSRGGLTNGRTWMTLLLMSKKAIEKLKSGRPLAFTNIPGRNG